MAEPNPPTLELIEFDEDDEALKRSRLSSARRRGYFRCPRCASKSFHPQDIENLYCGRCHWWTGDPTIPEVRSD